MGTCPQTGQAGGTDRRAGSTPVPAAGRQEVGVGSATCPWSHPDATATPPAVVLEAVVLEAVVPDQPFANHDGPDVAAFTGVV